MAPRGSSEDEKLRALLRTVREEAGLRQEDLARRLGRPQSHVSRFDAADKTLDFLEVRRVCRAIGLSFVEFVERYERAR
jgi:transcriptional regulator with XRE-family HTH domain